MLRLLIWTAVALALQSQGPFSMAARPATTPAAHTDLKTTVERLVRQLEAESLAQRDQAEQALIDLGLEVEPLLPPVNQRTPAEVAQRLQRVRQALQAARSKAAAQASVITFKADKIPLGDVLAELSRQSGNRIVDFRHEFGQEVTAPRLHVDFSQTPFWQALDTVLDQAELTVYGYGNAPAIFLVNRTAGANRRAGAGAYCGPFRVQATELDSIRVLQPRDDGSLHLELDVAWEPRLVPIALRQPLDGVQAWGNDGSVISVLNKQTETEVTPAPDSTTAELELPFQLPPRSVEKIATLKGKLVVLLAGPVDKFQFSDLPSETRDGKPMRVEQRRAAAVVSIERAQHKSDTWEIAMRVRFDEPFQALESHRNWILKNPAYLLGPAGERIEPADSEQTRQRSDEVAMTYLFHSKGAGQRPTFVYETPISFLEVPIAYELHDLPLP